VMYLKSDMKYVINSINNNFDYSFFMPLVARTWIHMGYQPISMLIGTRKSWKSNERDAYILDKVDNLSIIEFVQPIENWDDSRVARMGKLFAAAIPDLRDNDYLLISDVDMLPLNKVWFNQQDFNKKFHLINASICYIGAWVGVWREVMKIEFKNVREMLMKSCVAGDNIKHDEEFFSSRFEHSCCFKESQMILRGDFTDLDICCSKPGYQHILMMQSVFDKYFRNDANWYSSCMADMKMLDDSSR